MYIDVTLISLFINESFVLLIILDLKKIISFKKQHKKYLDIA